MFVKMTSKRGSLAWTLLGLVLLQSNGFKQLGGLFGAIRLRDQDFPANLNVTVLAPTDQAIQNFAASMGLSYEELLSRPALVDTLLSYHVIPARKLTGQGLVAGGATLTAKPISARTNANDLLRFQRLANSTITVTDVQNNTAQVAEPIVLPRANVFAVDRVLLNGDVFDNVTKLLQFHPEFTALAALLSQTPGVAGTFRANKFNHTLLAPTNAALAAASASLPPDAAGRARVLQYHTIARPGALPDDFRPGAPLMTLLPGHEVTVRYTRLTIPARFNSSRNVSFTTTTVLPEPGSPGDAANVTSTNIFAGRVSGRRHLLADEPAASRMASGRQLLRYGSRRASGFGGNGGNNDDGCDPGVDDGCGQPGYASSMMYQDLTDTSEELNSRGSVDAGDEF
ncbi:hypothetical protein COO60DRAFT_1639422 [Scenedesmus sp. NREL 46B-D3]|nr:hypothetical protein COO60DRAFT_1639422 [Scenedesmus sp. NREL 46B-D3]